MAGRRDVLVVTPTLGRRAETLTEMVASLRSQDVAIRHVIVAPAGFSPSGVGDAEVVIDPGRGLSAAFNAGLAVDDAPEYTYWLNDDDRVAPDGLARLITLLESEPTAVAAIGGLGLIDGRGDRVAALRGGRLAVRLLPWGPGMIASPAVLYRTAVIRRLDGLDERLDHAGDLDLLLRASLQGPILATREIVGYFRWHSDSLTVRDPRTSLREAEATRASFHARRGFAARSGYALWRPIGAMLTRAAKWMVTARTGRRGIAPP